MVARLTAAYPPTAKLSEVNCRLPKELVVRLSGDSKIAHSLPPFQRMPSFGPGSLKVRRFRLSIVPFVQSHVPATLPPVRGLNVYIAFEASRKLVASTLVPVIVEPVISPVTSRFTPIVPLLTIVIESALILPCTSDLFRIGGPNSRIAPPAL